MEYTEENALKSLLDAFGSLFSLDEIASAFCNAGKNADLAGDILYNMQESISSSSSTPITSDIVSDGSSSEAHYSDFSANMHNVDGKIKQKWRPVSGGTISSVLGKDYIRSMPKQQNNASLATNKPLKLDSKELPESAIWGTEACVSKDDDMHSDVEDFLFKMLGNGFQLSRDVIREVLEQCGYDMPKSMEKLLDRSTAALVEVHASTEKISKTSSNFEGSSSQKSLQHKKSSLGGISGSNANRKEVPRQQKERNALQKEILAAFFSTPDIFDQPPRRSVRTIRRSHTSGRVVTEPFRDPSPERIVVDLRPEYREDEDIDDENGYHGLRRAVKEYRVTMKEYYEAAVQSFVKGDSDRARKLLDQGNFFLEKARDADEQSNEKIFETGKSDEPDAEDMSLDLYESLPKDAIRLLKCHLSSLAGISTMKHLMVVIEKNSEDSSKGARRRLIMKLLERESIPWREGSTLGTIILRLDNINPEQLSFFGK